VGIFVINLKFMNVKNFKIHKIIKFIKSGFSVYDQTLSWGRAVRESNCSRGFPETTFPFFHSRHGCILLNGYPYVVPDSAPKCGNGLTNFHKPTPCFSSVRPTEDRLSLFMSFASFALPYASLFIHLLVRALF